MDKLDLTVFINKLKDTNTVLEQLEIIKSYLSKYNDKINEIVEYVNINLPDVLIGTAGYDINNYDIDFGIPYKEVLKKIENNKYLNIIINELIDPDADEYSISSYLFRYAYSYDSDGNFYDHYYICDMVSTKYELCFDIFMSYEKNIRAKKYSILNNYNTTNDGNTLVTYNTFKNILSKVNSVDYTNNVTTYSVPAYRIIGEINASELLIIVRCEVNGVIMQPLIINGTITASRQYKIPYLTYSDDGTVTYNGNFIVEWTSYNKQLKLITTPNNVSVVFRTTVVYTPSV